MGIAVALQSKLVSALQPPCTGVLLNCTQYSVINLGVSRTTALSKSVICPQVLGSLLIATMFLHKYLPLCCRDPKPEINEDRQKCAKFKPARLSTSRWRWVKSLYPRHEDTAIPRTIQTVRLPRGRVAWNSISSSWPSRDTRVKTIRDRYRTRGTLGRATHRDNMHIRTAPSRPQVAETCPIITRVIIRNR